MKKTTKEKKRKFEAIIIKNKTLLKTTSLLYFSNPFRNTTGMSFSANAETGDFAILPLPWNCPPHDRIYPNWVPEEWITRMTRHFTVPCENPSKEDKNFVDRFVITTRNRESSMEKMTWKAVYNLSMACLRYPDFEARYVPFLSSANAEEYVSKRVRPELASKYPNLDADALELSCERCYFSLIWKATSEHESLLRSVARYSALDYKTTRGLDLEIRRRIMARSNEEKEKEGERPSGYIETQNGMHYLFFNYVHSEKLRGRWMLVRHECKSCRCTFSFRDASVQCAKCGDRLECPGCGRVHVCL